MTQILRIIRVPKIVYKHILYKYILKILVIFIYTRFIYNKFNMKIARISELIEYVSSLLANFSEQLL